MTVTRDAQRLFTERHAVNERFIRTVWYPQGLRAFFLASSLLRHGLRVLDAGCGTGAVTLALHDALAYRAFVPQSFFQAFDFLTLGLARSDLWHRRVPPATLRGGGRTRKPIWQIAGRVRVMDVAVRARGGAENSAVHWRMSPGDERTHARSLGFNNDGPLGRPARNMLCYKSHKGLKGVAFGAAPGFAPRDPLDDRERSTSDSVDVCERRFVCRRKEKGEP